MQFTEKDLDNLSLLARITIQDNEKEKMLHDMQAILGHVSEINELQLEDLSQEDDNYNIVREDNITNNTSSRELLLQEAPETKDGYVEVSLVLRQ